MGKRGYRARVIGWALTISIFFLVGGYLMLNATADNCDKIHNLYDSIDSILVENSQRIKDGIRDGRIPSEDGKLYLENNREDRETLEKGDCNE